MAIILYVICSIRYILYSTLCANTYINYTCYANWPWPWPWLWVGPDHIFSMLHNMCSRLYGYMAVRVCVGCTTIRLCDYMAK